MAQLMTACLAMRAGQRFIARVAHAGLDSRLGAVTSDPSLIPLFGVLSFSAGDGQREAKVYRRLDRCLCSHKEFKEFKITRRRPKRHKTPEFCSSGCVPLDL